MSRNCPVRVLSHPPGKWDNMPMETILKSLADLGVAPEIIAALEAANDRENALLLLMDDDRHEYLD